MPFCLAKLDPEGGGTVMNNIERRSSATGEEAIQAEEESVEHKKGVALLKYDHF